MFRLRRITSLMTLYCSALQFRMLIHVVRLPRVWRPLEWTVVTPPPSPRPPSYTLLLGGLLGFFMGRDEEDRVPPAVKRQLTKAQRALREGDYDSAGRAYHNALRKLATSEHANAQAYVEARAVVLDKLANMYLEQGRLDDAEVTFKEAMRFMLTAGMDQESEAMVEISLKLSKIYTNQKKFELAEAGFEWCVQTAEKIYSTSQTENTTALWGMCQHSKGQYHLAKGEWGKAVHCLSEALKLSEDVFGPTHSQVAVLHNDLATALDAHGQYDKAESHARTSLEIMSQARVADSSGDKEYFVRVHYNLGMILIHQGRSAEARVALSKALEGANQLQEKALRQHILNLLDVL